MSTNPDNQSPLFFPYRPGASGYVLPKVVPGSGDASAPRVPPKERWMTEKHGNTVEDYLASGRHDIEEMRGILAKSGIRFDSVGNILEFGCGDGRMIRWLDGMAASREIWGTDIDATRLFWCKQNLSPALHFATTTIVPHLPFEDRHFDFIYAGSVFTHIDDLADAWFAELRRVLRPGGHLFVTVHLKDDLRLLSGRYKDSSLARHLRSHAEYDEFVGADFDVFTVGRSSRSFVFYDTEYLRRSLEPMFRVLSITAEVRLYQNALLLERQ
jgi:SAM-dependent methyltransferase